MGKTKKVYAVMCIRKKVNAMGIDVEISGIRGFIPVYETREEAEKVAGDTFQIQEMEIPDTDTDTTETNNED